MPRYVDSEIERRLADALRAHLDRCEACRAEEAGLRTVMGALSAWEPTRPTRDFGALMSLIELKEAAGTKQIRVPARVMPGWAVAGLAVVSIGIGVTLGAAHPGQTVVRAVPTQEQVVSALNLDSFDDSVHASLLHGIESIDEDVRTEGQR